MKKERINEIWGVVFLLFGLFTTASLIFFHPQDVSFYTSRPSTPVLNYTGVFGAHLAHALFISFGLGSYLIPFLFLIWAWSFFLQRIPDRKFFKFMGLAIALVAASVFLGISFYPEKRFLRAGAVGYVLGGRLLRYFGPLGSYIVTGSCFLLAALLATDFLIYPIFKALWESFAGSLKRSGHQFQKVLGWFQEFSGGFKRQPKAKPEPLREKKLLRMKLDFPEGPFVRTSFSEDSLTEKESKEKLQPLRTESPKTPAPPLKITIKEVKEKIPESTTTHQSKVPLTLSSSSTQAEDYQLPSLDLLRKPEPRAIQPDDLKFSSRIVEETLGEFGIEAKVVEVEQGPVITRYELLPAPGVKVSRIISLGDELSLALKAMSIRFITPIPGKSAIGIEVPNTKTSMVFLRELIESREFRNPNAALPLAIGKDTSGKPLVSDLAQMPHLLIAGTTGSGKTVCVNSIIAGLLYHAKPDRLKFVMVDPKMVEPAVYHSLPHMLAPVVTDAKKAAATIGWVVAEMENRYRLFASRGVRNIQGFNAQSEEALPYIVVVIDELADLMMVAQDKIEGAIARLAQLSRAVGIHLILATQRPSVDVITGVIKANFPARISFKVASKVDS